MRRFKDKVGIVSGAGTGIGEAMPLCEAVSFRTASSAIAHELADDGVAVAKGAGIQTPKELSLEYSQTGLDQPTQIIEG